MDQKKYFLGLDIGTDSVGYAATTEQFDLLKFHGEPVWGVHLFDAANLSDERRSFRCARRRLERRKQRVQLLQELMAKEIYKVDPLFLDRIKKAQLVKADKDYTYTLFEDEEYTDAEYYKEYPTIHHLIRDLMNSSKPHDVRLIYLACSWLVAHRGHFLNEIEKDHIDEIKDFSVVWNNFMSFLDNHGYTLPWVNTQEHIDLLANTLRSKKNISSKIYEIKTNLFQGKFPKEKEFTEDYPYSVENVIKLLCGSKVDAIKLFGDTHEEYQEIGSIALDLDDDKLAEIMGKLDDTDAEFVRCLKALYDWAVLVDILGGSESISESKVQIYETHKKDLEILKYLVRTYAKDQYNRMFRDADADNYTSYVYHVSNDAIPPRKAKKEDFLARVSKLLQGIQASGKVSIEDQLIIDDISKRIEIGTFMPKQKTTDNRVIPYQLYWAELDKILKNAESYLPFLKEIDDGGLSVSDKIKSIFVYRIPYFVGPLNAKNSQFAWIVRKAEGKILPWNFNDLVDLEASEEAFISKLIGKCTYLPSEFVLPKNSLIYERFSLLNQINKIKLDGDPISVDLKQLLYKDLFQTYRKVTRKKLEDYIRTQGYSFKELSGIDDQRTFSLTSYFDFKDFLNNHVLTEEEVESIIKRICCTEEKSRIKKWLAREFTQLNEEQIEKIARLKYKDFGRLSRKFLYELEGTSTKTGELTTIMATLWNTNDNLMEILSSSYTFVDEIQKIRKEYYDATGHSIEEQLEDLYISNQVKRPVLRSLEIVREVVKAEGCAPQKIFIEMARGGKPEQKGKRTKSRYDQVMDLYKSIQIDVDDLIAQLDGIENIDNALQGDKVFLYFMQLGKCMYTGEKIDLNILLSKDQSVYNIEHVFPQALVKDDSILNNKVLVLSTVNGAKQDVYPIDASIRHDMYGFWELLHSKKFITDEKFKRLTRSAPFSDDEKWGFINRQLTETTQSTKAVTQLLQGLYPDTEIVYVKARLASEFREEFQLYKSRKFNDLHHAKDAYLNIVVGEVYNMKFTKRWFSIDSQYSLNTDTIFEHAVECGGTVIWDGIPMLVKVKKTMAKNNAHMTTYQFTRHGGLFDQMPIKKKATLIPLKSGLSPEIYGGYNKATISFFILAKYKTNKKTDVMFVPIELMNQKLFEQSETVAIEFLKNKIAGYEKKPVMELSLPLGLRKIKINTMLSLDNFRFVISGISSGGKCLIMQPFMPFAESQTCNNYIKHLENYSIKVGENSKLVYNSNRDKISFEQNLQLYDLYIQKLTATIFSRRINNPEEILKTGRERFLTLSMNEQVKALLNIHDVFGRVAGGCDLSLIGGATHCAATISFSTKLSNCKSKNMQIIDQSTTGLWENKSINLKDLL